MHSERSAEDRGLFLGRVVENVLLCREHHRLIILIDGFPSAFPGQFVHLACHDPQDDWSEPGILEWDDTAWPTSIGDEAFRGEWAYIRRAFSIAGLQKTAEGVRIDVMFRVVGVGTRWMSSLKLGDEISVIGPIGNRFDVNNPRPLAYLVAGGIGLPPMRWLAQSLHEAGKQVIAFCGAVTRDLLPVTLAGPNLEPVTTDPARPAMSAAEFHAHHTPVVITTDDGSLGIKGYVTDALRRYHENSGRHPADITVYACGREEMLKGVADFCMAADIACQLCMERSMACGTGTCQSCAVPVKDASAKDGWRYRLCCTDGPVFRAEDIYWQAIS